MKPIGYIYLTTCTVNGKIYIGKHEFNGHYYLGSGMILMQAIKKYGKDKFKKKILRLCYDLHELRVWEHVYIVKYNATDRSIGYNIARGDVNLTEFNPAKLPEVREKMTKKNRETTSDPEYRKRQSEIMKEYYRTHVNPFKGKRHTEETKEKIRQKAIGRPSSNKGKPISEEQRRKQSIAMKGKFSKENNPNFGRRHSEEAKRKMSESKKVLYIGRKWITNGKTEKFVNIDNGIPQGYSLGRLKRKSNDRYKDLDFNQNRN